MYILLVFVLLASGEGNMEHEIIATQTQCEQTRTALNSMLDRDDTVVKYMTKCTSLPGHEA